MLSSWCRHRGVAQFHSGIMSPESHGIVERMNATIRARLRRYYNNRRQTLTKIQLEQILNNAVNRTTGFTPNELFFGLTRQGERVPESTRLVWMEQANVRSQKARDKTTMRSLGTRHRKTPFRPGDLVLVWEPERKTNSLQSNWTGPHILKQAIGNSLWLVAKGSDIGVTKGIYHSCRLSTYKCSRNAEVFNTAGDVSTSS